MKWNGQIYFVAKWLQTFNGNLATYIHKYIFKDMFGDCSWVVQYSYIYVHTFYIQNEIVFSYIAGSYSGDFLIW